MILQQDFKIRRSISSSQAEAPISCYPEAMGTAADFDWRSDIAV
jgi:hypothetical protein